MAKEEIERICAKCRDTATFAVEIQDLHNWRDGQKIQDAMPYLTKEQRDLLISGYCGECINATAKQVETGAK